MLPILIVEDEPNIATLIEMALEPLGQPLVVAHDGEHAADLVETQKFDLVLLDIMLPGVDGFALMQYLAPTGTPVVFLTAKNAVADRVRGLKLGAYDYIVKPFAPAELLARVEGILRHTGRRDAVLHVWDADIDPDSRTVTRAGRAVELTRGSLNCCWCWCVRRGRRSTARHCMSASGASTPSRTPARWICTSTACGASWGGRIKS